MDDIEEVVPAVAVFGALGFIVPVWLLHADPEWGAVLDAAAILWFLARTRFPGTWVVERLSIGCFVLGAIFAAARLLGHLTWWVSIGCGVAGLLLHAWHLLATVGPRALWSDFMNQMRAAWRGISTHPHWECVEWLLLTPFPALLVLSMSNCSATDTPAAGRPRRSA